MSRLKIKDMPPVEVVDGTEIIPTGGKGDVSVTVERIKNYVYSANTFTSLASQLQTVDLRSQSNETSISNHVSNIANPHQVTKAQVGLGNVDNTSDLNKPISTATQAAITNLNNTKADVTYIDGLLAQKANITYVDSNLALKADTTYVDSELSLKADITYVDSGLATKLGVSSNAVSSSKLETPRSISITGDGNWSTTFDGSSNATGVMTLSNTAVVSGSYGNSVNIPSISVDSKGRLTSVTNTAIRSASTTQSGIVQLINDLTTGGIDKALTAEQGKLLLAMFANSLLENGRLYLPNPTDQSKPIIVQWGKGASGANNVVAKTTFSVAYTTKVLAVSLTSVGSGLVNLNGVYAFSQPLDGINVASPAAAAQGFNYIVIGY